MAGEVSGSLDFLDNDEELVDGYLDELDFLDDIVQPDRNQAPVVSPVQLDRNQAPVASLEVPEKPPDVLEPIIKMPFAIPQDVPLELPAEDPKRGENLLKGNLTQDIAERVRAAIAQIRSPKENASMKTQSGKPQTLGEGKTKKEIVPLSMSSPIRFRDTIRKLNDSDSLEPGECSDSSEETKMQKRAERFGLKPYKSKIVYNEQVSYLETDKHALDGKMLSSSSSYRSINPDFRGTNSYPSYENYSYSQGQHPDSPYESSERLDFPHGKLSNPVQVGKHITKMHGDEIQLFTRKKIKQHYEQFKVSMSRHKSNSCEETVRTGEKVPGPRLKTSSTAIIGVPLQNVKEIKKCPTATVDGIECLSVKKRKDSKSEGVEDVVVNPVLVRKNRLKKRVHVDSSIEPNMQVKKVKRCTPSAPIGDIDCALLMNMNKKQRQKARKRLRKQLACLEQDSSSPRGNNQNEPDLKEIQNTVRKKRSASIQNSISTDCSSLYEVFDIASPLSEGNSYFNQGTVSPAYHEPFDPFPTNTSENCTRKNEDDLSPVSISSLQTVHRSSSPGESIYDGLVDLCLKSPSGVLSNEENTRSNQSFILLSTTEDNSPLQVRDKSPSPVVDSSTSPCIKRKSRHSRQRAKVRAKLKAALPTADNHPTNSNKQSVSSYDDVLSSSAYESSASVQFVNSVSQKLPSDGSEISISLSVPSNMSGFSEKSEERAPRLQSLNVRTDSNYGKSSLSRSSTRKYRVRSVSSSGSVEHIPSPTGSWHSTGSQSRSGNVSMTKSSSRRLKSSTKSHQHYRTVSEGKRSTSRNTHSRSRSVSVSYSRNRRSSPSSNPISSPTRTRRFSSSSRNRRSSSRSRALRSSSPSRDQRSSSPSRTLRSSSPSRTLRSSSPSRTLRSSSPSRNRRSSSPSSNRRSSSPSRNRRSSSPSRNRRSSSPSRNWRSSSPSRTLRSSSPSRSLRSRSRSRTRRSHAYSRNCRSGSHSKRKRSRSLSRTRLYRSRHSRSSSFNRRSRSANRSRSPHRASSRNTYHQSRGRGGSPRRYRRSTSRSRRRSRIISPLGHSKTTLKKSSLSRDEALKYLAKPVIATELFAKSDKFAPLSIQPTPVIAATVNLTDVNSIAAQPNISNTSIPFPYYSINVQGNNYYNQQGPQPDIPGVGAYTPLDTAGYSMTQTLQVSHQNVEYIRHHQHQQQQQHYHQMYMQQYPPLHCVPEPHFSGQDIHYTRPNLQPVPSAAAGVPDMNCCPNAAQPSTPTDPATNQGQKPNQGLSPNKRQNQTLKPGLIPKQGLTLNDGRKTNLISVPVTYTPISMSIGKPLDCSSDITVSKDVEEVLQNDNEHETNAAVLVGNELISGNPNQGKPDKGQAQICQDASVSECDKVMLCLEEPDLFETSVPNIQTKRDQSKITINLLCNAPKLGATQIAKNASVNKSNNRVAWSTKYTDTSTARNFTSMPTVPVLKSTVCGSQETLANGIVDRRFSFGSDVTALQEIVHGSVDVVKSCSGLSSKNSLPNEMRDRSNVETIENPSKPVLIDDILKRLKNVLCVPKRTVSTQVTWTGNTFRGSSDAIEESDNAQNIALYDDISKLLK